MVTIAAENFMVGAFGWNPLDMTTAWKGHRCGDVASVVEVGLARKAEESGQETFHMRVFDDVRTRLVCVKAEFFLGEGDPMAGHRIFRRSGARGSSILPPQLPFE